MSGRERHPGDILRVVLGALVIAITAPLARMDHVSQFETDVFRVFNHLPDGMRYFFEAIMQFGALPVAIGIALVALLFRRKWLALDIALASSAAWVAARLLKDVIGRGRPADVLSDVIVRGPHPSGFGYPSGHAAVSAAVATALGPFVPRRVRRLLWCVVALVGIARMYVGAHLPLDIVGGAAIGWAVTAVVHLVLGTPRTAVDPAVVRRAFEHFGMKVVDVRRVSADARGSTPFFVTVDDGRRIFVKAVTREERDADLLFKTWRFVALRHVEDEAPYTSPKHAVEHEALGAALAYDAGVHTARPITATQTDTGLALLALECVSGRGLDEVDTAAVTDDVLARVWEEVAKLQHARIAHRDLRLANVMVDDTGQPWLIDFGFAEIGASDRRLAQDVAELIGSSATIVGNDRAIRAAIRGAGRDAVIAALPLLQPLALSSATRHALGRKGVDRLRTDAADAAGVERVQLDELARFHMRTIVMLVAALLAIHLLAPQVSELHETLDAARRAEAGWLGLAIFASVMTYVGATLSLAGTVETNLPFGVTFLSQIASSFTNRITPAGLGGLGVNTRYLQRNGVSAGDAVGAVGLNSAAGFVVHLTALVIAAVLFGRHDVGDVHLPDKWWVLVAVVVVLFVAGVLVRSSFGRRRVVAPLGRVARQLLTVLHEPGKALLLFGGSAVVTGSYILALGWALAAFHANAAWVSVASIYLAGSAVSAAAPTPGGLGAIEAALIAGLTGVGVANGPAVAGVLSFRLATFWLPIIPGWLAFRSLTKRELL